MRQNIQNNLKKIRTILVDHMLRQSRLHYLIREVSKEDKNCLERKYYNIYVYISKVTKYFI